MKVHVYCLAFKISGIGPGPGRHVPGFPDYVDQTGQLVVQLVEPILTDIDLKTLVEQGEKQFGQPRSFKGHEFPTNVQFQSIAYLGHHENGKETL